MKILNTAQIKEWDAYTILHEPISSLDLMDRAASSAFAFFKDYLQANSINLDSPTIAVICGQGNNAGDGLVFAKLLQQEGREVQVYVLKLKDKGSPDFEANLASCIALGIPIKFLENEFDLLQIPDHGIWIDALYGSGLSKNLQGLSSMLVQAINEKNGVKIAIDIPSGLFGDIQEAIQQKAAVIFKSDITYTFQQMKTSFLFPETGGFAGECVVVPIGLHPAYLKAIQDSWFWLEPNLLQHKPSSKFDFKWEKGHALMIAGSYGKVGAALLSSKAALRAGCGLVSAYVPKVAYTIFQTAFPEAMVETDEELTEIRNFPDCSKYDAIGIGPGLGFHPYTVRGFGNWIKHIKTPLVIDADGLNICAELLKMHPDFSFPKNCILTPHHKEFDRLFGKCNNSFERLNLAIEKARQYEIIIVLKSAHTAIVTPHGNVFFNSTGNNLLATAGSGDVLTGIVTAMLTKGFEPIEAAKKAVFLHGILANSLQAKGYKNIIASDLVEELKWHS
jgi:ADP-dependent NAD(P)H-hydrate dehydratase / NAD(P)H-hydrate epimerase